MPYNITVELEDLAGRSFGPRPFGGSSQIVLNTTSFTRILSQLNNVGESFNAQAALKKPGPLSLLSTGCYLNATSEHAMARTGLRAGDGFRDCAAACAHPSTMFNSSFTLWNCLTLAAASAYLADVKMIVDRESVAAAGRVMGFETLNQFNATQIFGDTLSCIKGSCQAYSVGSCSANITTLDISGSENQVLALWTGLHRYCSGIKSLVNSDIAGPGVVLSYILQAVIAITVYVLINIFTGWLQPLLSFNYTVQDRAGWARPKPTEDTSVLAQQQRRKTPWKRAGENQRALGRSRPAAALTSALIEFQEVQTFFVLSIQVATLVIFWGDDRAAMLNSTNTFAEAITNVEIVQLLSINGMLPVLFTQLGLVRLGVRWWYLTALVLAVFVNGVFVARERLMPDYATLWTYFKSESAIDQCGGNPSPMTYCLDSLAELETTLVRMNDGLIAGNLVIFALLLDQLWHTFNRNGALSARLDRWELEDGKVVVVRRRVVPVLLHVMWSGMELILLIYVGIYLKSVTGILKFVGLSPSNWTFGQIIAIMVWAPVVGKFMYFNAFGIPDGVGKRLHKRYRIVEVEEGDDDADSKPGRPPRGTSEGDIEMGVPRRDTMFSLSREDTLVASLKPATAASADSRWYNEHWNEGEKDNPFDDRAGKF